ncbi:glycerol-3-phosphate responsive antiterminator [Staphylococcus massiliensis]|uniref:Glycerol uptake operon antiterminator regulatory protein n=1 Tax=Staphylococcus massiliensis S46 TaxID=1229783 RepID=K9B6Q8_9STAP|nr:glycerol-3-phosphate responsive antiterminator [Staphylococcus massiliensis]EKU50517.1 glycerol-3-phosphate responsive antiterminator [Staphylococcus massiliensis S46]MCG3398712.1 glycerol-3-phosphate responsive antiterminator [Staphylococcus massiliensis]MCG3401273.1 glycerol-3-phosphate responsive antiterminator [Staphylococcus massiliensis]MCG3412550.1 glycerol-3-phosphate responsive antiterminator [Staphylococcus massiliensis]POA00387.1 glycerol-3-phosphate responsive antiterminator [St
MNEKLLPAIRTMKDLEKLIATDHKTCVLLDTHIGHLKSILELLKKHQIEYYIHIDLIKGLSVDEFSCEYIIQQYKPKGIISTKSKVIKKAKALKTTTILRVFIIDSHALDRSIALIKHVEPDFVEVLPGVANKVIRRINEETNTHVIAGGLIDTEEEVEAAVKAGATYITSSNRTIW